MQTIIWAFGSMLVFVLIITFFPLGITLKGKFLISMIGFLLALGGLAAAITYPLWQTALIIAALIFFIAYFMDRQVGSVLYIESPLNEDGLGKFEGPVIHNPFLVVKVDNLLNTVVEEIDLPTFFDDVAMVELGQVSERPEFIQVMDKVKEIEKVEENLSLFFERKINSKVGEQNIGFEQATDYLTKIKGVHEEEDSDDLNIKMDSHTFEKISDIPSINTEDLLPKNIGMDELELLDDPTFEFLFAIKEGTGDDTVKTKENLKNSKQ